MIVKFLNTNYVVLTWIELYIKLLFWNRSNLNHSIEVLWFYSQNSSKIFKLLNNNIIKIFEIYLKILDYDIIYIHHYNRSI